MKIYFETCFKNFLCFVTFECFGECDQYKKTPNSPFCILKVFGNSKYPWTVAWGRSWMGTYLVWSRKWVSMLEPNFQLARWNKFHHNSNLKSLHNHIPSKFSFYQMKNTISRYSNNRGCNRWITHFRFSSLDVGSIMIIPLFIIATSIFCGKLWSVVCLTSKNALPNVSNLWTSFKNDNFASSGVVPEYSFNFDKISFLALSNLI